jgi:hypothetical protein
MFYICYNILGLKRVNPFQPPKIEAFFGMERVNPFEAPQNCSIFGKERINPFQPKKL